MTYDKALYLVIDQGTSAGKVFLFNRRQEAVFSTRFPHRLSRPAPGQVESDPLVILEGCFRLIKEAIDYAAEHQRPIAMAGLSVQRSTFLFWERQSARPLTPAISWQDTRAIAEVNKLSDQADLIQKRTGIPLSAHFGGPKFMHLVNQDPALARGVANGTVLFGPLSAFLSQSFTGVSAMDQSIAGRSLFVNLDRVELDDDLLNLFGANRAVVPPLLPTGADYGQISLDNRTVPLGCVVGDQQAALLGQGGWATGDLALNYGTSGSVLLNTGPRPAKIPGLVSSVLYSDAKSVRYIVEGTINTCKSIFDWLEHDLAIPVHRRKWNRICAAISTTGVIIPGFSGMAAPYWCDRFPTLIDGIERANTDEIIRAAVESIGFFSYDILRLIQHHLPVELHSITASGGLSRAALLQFIADLLGQPIRHTSMKDHTALGVFNLLYKLETGVASGAEFREVYNPQMDAEARETKIKTWRAGLEKCGITPVE